MNKTLEQLEEVFAQFVDEAKKAGNGNKSAGARARKLSMQARELFKKWKTSSLQN